MGITALERPCPWWVGYLLLNPLRRLVQSAEKSFGYLLSPGMTVLEVGPGMGFFSLDTARLLGPRGRLVCVDVQAKMIEVLKRRAAKAGLSDRIETRICDAHSLGVDDLADRVDLALVIFSAHEVPYRKGLFDQVKQTLKSEGTLFLAEPRIHVTRRFFDEIEAAAQRSGLNAIEYPRMFGARAVLMAESPRATSC